MTLRDELNALTPRLRRYARALTTGHPSPCERADELVQATLMRALGARTIGSSADLAVRLYATVTQLHREIAMAGKSALAAGIGRPPTLVSADPDFPPNGRQTKLSAALINLPLDEREALLLVALEGFDHSEAARILRISRGVLLARLTQARTAVDRHLRMAPGAPAKPPAKTGRGVPHLRLVT